MNKIIESIQLNKIIAIIRDNNESRAYQSAVACIKGGINIIEITLNTENALHIIKKLALNHPNIPIGAGTVLSKIDAENAISAGVSFIVSPHTDKEIIEHCKKNNIVVIPGASTPTEIMNAHKMGADIVKIFPAGCLGGSKYIKDILAPLSHIKLMPTGGINTENIGEYINAGAFAVGISRSIFITKETSKPDDFSVITRLTQELIKKVFHNQTQN